DAKYPAAHFSYVDSSIGGTGSDLGVFRLERDCLAYNPALVFVDFSVNDGLNVDKPKKFATYESIVRRIVLKGSLVIPVIFPFHHDAEPGTAKNMPGRTKHIKIAEAYNAPVGDAVLRIQNMVAEEKATIKKTGKKPEKILTKRIWNIDYIHPGDFGYEIFADAAWGAFEKGIKDKMVCEIPEKMLHADTYMSWSRTRISQFGTLPKGWKVTTVSRTAAWYDGYMARYLDDVVIATGRTKNIEPIIVKFKASFVMIYGQETTDSGKYQIILDGKERKVINLNSKRYGGNRQHYETIAGLDPSKIHTLEIRPILTAREVIRLESICLAGGEAKIVK
ncbi:MAG: hypothetical protein HRT89_23310, partial [Lentisphaeria bacterium]|nr:hypothetical protein [Lentisphaeria bacterium]